MLEMSQLPFKFRPRTYCEHLLIPKWGIEMGDPWSVVTCGVMESIICLRSLAISVLPEFKTVEFSTNLHELHLTFHKAMSMCEKLCFSNCTERCTVINQWTIFSCIYSSIDGERLCRRISFYKGRRQAGNRREGQKVSFTLGWWHSKSIYWLLAVKIGSRWICTNGSKPWFCFHGSTMQGYSGLERDVIIVSVWPMR